MVSTKVTKNQKEMRRPCLCGPGRLASKMDGAIRRGDRDVAQIESEIVMSSIVSQLRVVSRSESLVSAACRTVGKRRTLAECVVQETLVLRASLVAAASISRSLSDCLLGQSKTPKQHRREPRQKTRTEKRKGVLRANKEESRRASRTLGNSRLTYSARGALSKRLIHQLGKTRSWKPCEPRIGRPSRLVLSR